MDIYYFNVPCHFYPRPLRGGRLLRLDQTIDQQAISIHALCEEGDQRRGGKKSSMANFYPRPLRGGRPTDVVKQRVDFLISIHALCEEGDV